MTGAAAFTFGFDASVQLGDFVVSLADAGRRRSRSLPAWPGAR